ERRRSGGDGGVDHDTAHVALRIDRETDAQPIVAMEHAGHRRLDGLHVLRDPEPADERLTQRDGGARRDDRPRTSRARVLDRELARGGGPPQGGRGAPPRLPPPDPAAAAPPPGGATAGPPPGP